MNASRQTDAIVVGNGILGYSIAFALLHEAPSISIALIGPASRPACASIAAGAMLNSFAEIEEDSLAHEPGRVKFGMNRAAAALWPAWVEQLNASLGEERVAITNGTYILHNTTTDSMEDRNFAAILSALAEYKEPFEEADPASIVGLKPAAQSRPLRALYIPGEGAIPSGVLIGALEEALRRSPRVSWFDEDAAAIAVADGGQKQVTTAGGTVLGAPHLILAGGARTQDLLDRFPALQGRTPRLYHGVGVAMVLRTQGESPEKVIRTPNRGMACGVHVVPYDRDHCYIGATNLLGPVGESRPRMTSLYGLMQAAMNQVNTSYYRAHMDRWVVGSRPTTFDLFPLLGETSVPGLWMVTGTRREGLHLSPFLARSLTRELIGGAKVFPRMFAPERDPLWTLTREEGIRKAVQHLKSSAYQHDLQLPNNGWEEMIDQMLENEVEAIYARCGIEGHGVPPEILGMYRGGDPALGEHPFGGQEQAPRGLQRG